MSQNLRYKILRNWRQNKTYQFLVHFVHLIQNSFIPVEAKK